MGFKIAEAFVEIAVDRQQLKAGLAGSRTDVDKWYRDVDARFTSIRNNAAKVFLPLVGAGAGLVKLASDAEESESKFAAVFKAQTASARAFSEQLAKATNRSGFELRDFMSSVQSTLVPMGFMRKDAAVLSGDLTKLAVDLASFNNAAEPETLDLLVSALMGNHEAVRRFGIAITEGTLNQQLLAMGFKKTTQGATEQQKVMARMAIIFRSTADAQGDAERTARGFANKMRGVTARAKELGIQFGNELLPVAHELLDWAGDAVRWFADLDDLTKRQIVNWGSTAVAVSGATVVLSKFASMALSTGKALMTLRAAMIAVDAASGLGGLGKRVAANAATRAAGGAAGRAVGVELSRFSDTAGDLLATRAVKRAPRAVGPAVTTAAHNFGGRMAAQFAAKNAAGAAVGAAGSSAASSGLAAFATAIGATTASVSALTIVLPALGAAVYKAATDTGEWGKTVLGKIESYLPNIVQEALTGGAPNMLDNQKKEASFEAEARSVNDKIDKKIAASAGTANAAKVIREAIGDLAALDQKAAGVAGGDTQMKLNARRRKELVGMLGEADQIAAREQKKADAFAAIQRSNAAAQENAKQRVGLRKFGMNSSDAAKVVSQTLLGDTGGGIKSFFNSSAKAKEDEKKKAEDRAEERAKQRERDKNARGGFAKMGINAAEGKDLMAGFMTGGLTSLLTGMEKARDDKDKNKKDFDASMFGLSDINKRLQKSGLESDEKQDRKKTVKAMESLAYDGVKIKNFKDFSAGIAVFN